MDPNESEVELFPPTPFNTLQEDLNLEDSIWPDTDGEYRVAMEEAEESIEEEKEVEFPEDKA